MHSGSAEVAAELQDRIQAIKLPPPVQKPADVIFPADNQHRVGDIAIPPLFASGHADTKTAVKHQLGFGSSKGQVAERAQPGKALGKREFVAVAPSASWTQTAREENNTV